MPRSPRGSLAESPQTSSNHSPEISIPSLHSITLSTSIIPYLTLSAIHPASLSPKSISFFKPIQSLLHHPTHPVSHNISQINHTTSIHNSSKKSTRIPEFQPKLHQRPPLPHRRRRTPAWRSPGAAAAASAARPRGRSARPGPPGARPSGWDRTSGGCGSCGDWPKVDWFKEKNAGKSRRNHGKVYGFL